MKKVTFLSIIALLLIFVQNSSGQVPVAPTDLKVVPIYGVNRMRLTWTDNSGNEDGFKIERKTGAGDFVEIHTTAANATEFIDEGVETEKEYTYRVCAHNANGNSAWSNEASNGIAICWALQAGSHNMLNSWQDATPGNIWGFHEGVDVLAGGSGGEVVVACRGGVIRRRAPLYAHGHFSITVLENGNTMFDRYLHVAITNGKVEGEPVSPGEALATINPAAYPAGRCHLHQGLLNNWVGVQGVNRVGDGGNMENPFTIFSENADQDPGGKDPGLHDTNSDGRTVIYKRPDNNYIMDGIIYNDVDISAEVTDNMGTGTRQGLYKAGYWVDALQPTSADIKDAEHPYLLYNFAGWFGETPPARNRFDAIYDPGQVTTYPAPFNPKRHHNLVTNTKGTDGTVAKLDANQYWRTKAKQGTGTHDNGSDAEITKINDEAKFKDGRYAVHIVMHDMIHSVDNGDTRVVVDNFRPYVKKVNVQKAGGETIYCAEWRWNQKKEELKLCPTHPDRGILGTANSHEDLIIEITASEPMRVVSIPRIDPLGLSLSTPNSVSSDSTKWSFVIPKESIPDDGSANGKHIIWIWGWDYANNFIEGYTEAKTSYGAAEIPQRQNDGSWNPPGMPETERLHRFTIGIDLRIAPAKATDKGDDIRLDWIALDDEVGATQYVVYRGVGASVQGDSLAETTDTCFIDPGAAGDTNINYFYAVEALGEAGSELIYPRRVVEFDKEMPPGQEGRGGYHLVSWPLVVHNDTTQFVFSDSMGFGCQLTGGSAVGNSDQVKYFDSATSTWYTAWYEVGGRGPDGWKGNLTNIETDKGYWIIIRGDHPAVTLTMTGWVNWVVRDILIQPGRSFNYVGSCFAEPCSLSEAGLVSSGFTGSYSSGKSDKVRYYKNGDWYSAWYMMGGPGPDRWRGNLTLLEPGNGYIIEVLEGHAFIGNQWVYLGPTYGVTKAAMSSSTRVPVKREGSKQVRHTLGRSTNRSLDPDKVRKEWRE